ncbi:RNA polymerase sigma factor [Sporolactobacillus shoreae]|nr:sigma-70 family RNA polymerase sigma factor [Sporolactobacillus shoreae]
MESQQQISDSRFEERFKPYMALIRRYCVSLAGSSWDGDDLFQTSMIRLIGAWRKKPDRPITKAYLYRIISSAWIDGHRKASVDETVKDSFEDHAVPRADRINEDALIQGVKRMISCLTPKQSLVFMMLAGWTMAPAEAAEHTGETEGNIRVIYHRARKKLRAAGMKKVSREADQRALRYADAFQSRDPARLLQLYWEESGRQVQPLQMVRTYRRADGIRMAA